MSQLYRRRLVLAKIETTEGTDSVPVVGTNAILCGNITVTPLGGSTVDRDVTYASFGAIPKIHVNKQVMVSFDVEIAGAGAAGSLPKYGVLLRGCGLSETVSAGVKVEYAPVSASQESVTLYCNESGTLHKLVGARGSVSFKFPKDGLPAMSFNFVGRWTPAAAVALASIDVSAFVTPIPVGLVNTPTFTVDGFAAVMEDLQIDLGNTVVHRDRPNAEYVPITDRQISGSMVIEFPDLGTKDFFGIAVANTLVVRALVHGIVAGNIFQIDEPKVQLLQPAYSNVDGIRCLSMNTISARGTTDDTDIKITVK